MKLGLYVSAAAMLIFAACTNAGAGSQDSADNAADSSAIIAQQDSLRAAEKMEIEKSFENPVSLEVKNATIKYGESSCGTATTTVALTNNTKVELEPADYVICYDYQTEVFKAGEILDATSSNTVKGPKLPAGDTVEFTFKQTDASAKIAKPTVKIIISKDDFMKKAVNI